MKDRLLKGQIAFLRDELKEKGQLINSLLEELFKCNNTIKISQELSKKKYKIVREQNYIKRR